VGLARTYAVGGAIAFAASLATAIVLDRRLGRGVTADLLGRRDLVALLVNLGLFSVFALHHSVMARTGIKAGLSRHLAPALERSTYVWVASALFALVCLAWRPMPSLVYDVDAPWAWALTAARLVGVWLTLDAASRIDPRELAGLRQAWSYGFHQPDRVAGRPAISSSGATAEPETGPLVARGGYRLVRHPIYLGWILMVWGAPVASAGRLTFAAVSTLYLLLAIPFEERSLRERFGESYRGYTRLVRWRVLPGLY
jgi:protein-S-isoprenylcysteine O-methyltransferase Ste14